MSGVDPKFLSDWQADSSAFAFPPWDNPSEWDTSQESSPDADFPDPASLTGSLNGDRPDINLLDRASDFLSTNFSSQDASPERFVLAEAPIETKGSCDVSPRTLSSTTDDNIETWQQFRLLPSLPGGMPPEAQYLYPYSKGRRSPTNPVVVEDVGELAQSQEIPDVQPIMPFQSIPQAFPFVSGPWSNAAQPTTAENLALAPEPVPLSVEPEMEAKDGQNLGGFQDALRSLDWRWFSNPDARLSANPGTISFSTLPQDLSFQQDGQSGSSDSPQHTSKSSSIAGDMPGIYDFPYLTTGVDMTAFPEQQQLSDESDSQDVKWENTPQVDGLPDVSQTRSSSNAPTFVNETPSESLMRCFPSRPGTASSAAKRAAVDRIPLSLQSVITARKRRQRNSTSSIELPQQPKPLQIVQEDGQGGSIASADFVSPPRGARRKGPLSTIGRANAGLRRKNKDTCVQCRLNKRKCDGHSPCDACRPTLHEQPCARACFANIVEYGTCNYISQRAINHPTIDGSGRVRIEIPSSFDLNDLLSFLGERQGRFNIRATQAWGSLYVLDLGETYRFLKSLSEYNGNSRSSFLEFIDRRLVESKDKSKNWLSCLRDCDPMNHVYALLSQWNNMPSRAKYSFVPLQPGTEEQPMDTSNPEHKREILLAAQLSRIFCRMLEVEGFRKLERDFYNIKWKQISHDTHVRFLSELGHILLSLRWRVSWWKRLGDGGKEPDPSKQHYVDRVELLCRILYVYYTCVLAKLPSWSISDVPKGIWSTYADTEKAIWDDYPLDPTDAGFQNWMGRGREIIEEAGIVKRFAKN